MRRDVHSRHATRAVVASLPLLLALAPRPAVSQTVPTGFQEYFVLGFEQHVWDMLTRVQTGEGGPAFASGTNSVVSATASADGQRVTYDHWEDGLEADVTAPVQPTTLVLGDANPANGRACDFTTDPRIFPCDGTDDDVLFAGSFLNFASDQGLGCAPPPNDLNCSVPVNPRSTADVRYDGGDLLVSSGGPLSLVHPQDPLSPFIGGATEIIPRQAVSAATSYTIPIGEDIYGGNNSVTEPFKYVDLNLVAFDDGTSVNIASPGFGNVSFTLNRGEHYSSQGWIGAVAAPAITINAGTRISTSGPLAGLIFTGGDGTFATRFYSLLPDILHSADYITTAPGDDPLAQGSRPLNLYIFNPDPLNALSITATDNVGTTVINVPASAQIDYFTGTGRFVPTGSTVRMTGDRRFWGVSAYDHQSPSNDWGHSWLAREFVTTTYTVPFAPGVNNPATVYPSCGPPPCDTLNRSPVFVAASLDNTQIQIDFDNDGTFDVVDTNGDDFPDPAPLPNNTYVINSLQALRVYDWTDYDNTGTLVVANRPVAVAYGQDTDQATGPDPIQDTGYAIYPIDQRFLDPVLVIDKTVDMPVIPTAGGVVTYTLTVSSFDFGPLTGLQVYDLLPPGVTGADYVPGSTLVTYPDLSQDTSDPAASIDPGTGRDRLDWTLSPDSLATHQTLTVRYSINIPAAPGGVPRRLTNEGHAEGSLGSSVFAPLDTAEVVQSDLLQSKSVMDDGSPEAGEVLTYTLTVSNNGLAAETNAVITDAIPADTTFVPGSITTAGPFTGTYSAGQNAVVWTAVNFPVGGPHVLTFQVVVNPGTPAGTVVTNEGTYESDQTPLFPTNEVETQIVGPALVVSKSGAGLLHPNEVATFEVFVENVGDGTANNARIVDFYPANTTYVAESMEWRRNLNPFTAVTDAADADEGTAFLDRVELLVATLGAGEDLTFRFEVRVDPGTDGLFVNNQATITSDEVLPTDTNLVQIPIMGNADVTGRVFLDLDGDGVQDPGEPGIPNVDVVATNGAGEIQIVSTDVNGDYLATVDLPCYEDGFGSVAYDGSDGDLDWSGAGDEWVEFSASGTLDDQDPTTTPLAVVADPLGVFGNSLEISGGPAAETRGFTRQVDLSALAGFAAGLATLSFDFRRSSMEATDFVTLDIDYDNDGTFNDVLATFPGIGTDATWQSASFVLDPAQLPDDPVVFRFDGTNFNFSNDTFYVDNVSLCSTEVTLNVDETDPDFPEIGAVLTTAPGCVSPPTAPCNDPQTVNAVVGGTVAAGPVGYDPGPLTVDKTSDALGGELVPGETVTYTISVENTSGIDQTGVTLTDPLPAGTLAVPGSTMVTVENPAIRATEYPVTAGSFTGTTFDLTLNQALEPDYFVIVQGSDGVAGGGGNRGPDENYAALTQDPFGTGGLGTSAGASTLRFERGNAVDSWVGVVTVVECLAGCDDDGFRLLDARRVVHGGATTTGSVASSTAWADIGQVMLMGGFNGSGCTTGDGDVADTKVCHVRLFPSGIDQINWTRNGGGGATLSAATSTVMVVDWGSAWTVQRRRIQGTNGGNGADAVGEYNTAAISAVDRLRTWVWGTGHTTDNGIGDAAEGILLTLGDGVNQNASESLLAAGGEFNDTLDFEVYALTHPDLAVDFVFLQDGAGGTNPGNGAGDTDELTETVAVAAAPTAGRRMALSTNGQNGTGTAFPRPMFSTRYLDPTTVQLERRRSGQPFPAWVQGVDFSSVVGSSTFAGGDPSNLVTLGDSVTLHPGGILTVTFQARVDPDLAGGITQITNTATVDTDQEVPENVSVTDDVIRLDVTVEPNNAGFTVAGDSITYTHTVTNTGMDPDSYDLTLTSERGWIVELIDPATGTVIATDSNGDGVWDGGVTVNTGSLAPGESADYRVRVNVPGGTPLGTEETTTLTATSDRYSAGVSAFATDETTIIDGVDVGPILLTPDHSGVVGPGGSIVYTHAVVNDTGATDTFDLTAFPSQPGWTATLYADSNGDGVYTPGFDVAIMNTLQLADGQLQTFFAVVEAPPGATPGDTDVTTLTAVSQNDPDLFAGATDTTTVTPATSHDLSGGGTRLVDAGDTPVFPGTIRNLQESADRFDFTITPSPFFGLDGLLHPTQLWVDTDADGIPDLQIAEDADGDGTWNTVDPAFDVNMDGNPDVSVLADGQLAYELRRPVDPAQLAYREPVTLRATSQATGEVDGVTATNLLAAATHALVGRFEAVRTGGRVLLEWETASEVGTVGFFLERGGERLPSTPLPALLVAPQGGTYRFVDDTAPPGEALAYTLVEVDARGRERRFGPVDLGSGLRGSVELPVGGYERKARPSLPRPFDRSVGPTMRTGTPSGRARVRVAETGLIHVSAADLAPALGVPEPTVESWILAGTLRVVLDPFEEGVDPCARTRGGPDLLFTDGFESGDLCAWSEHAGDLATGHSWLAEVDGSGLYFFGESIDSLYTNENVYWIEHGLGRPMSTVDGGSPSASPGGSFLEELHLEEESVPLTAAIDDPERDFWFWDFLFGGDTKSYAVPTPGAVPGADGSSLTVRLQGQTDAGDVAPDHRVLVRVNGSAVGEGSWDGAEPFELVLPLDPGVLQDGTNSVEIESVLLPGVPFDVIFLESFDVRYRRRYRASGDVLAAPAEGRPVLTLEGFSEDPEVFDVTDPARLRRVVGTTTGSDGGTGTRVSFETTSGDSRYWALPLDEAREGEPEVDLASDLRSPDGGAEYLVVAPPGLEAGAELLAAYRQSLGVSSRVVRLQDVYDEFHGGVVDPAAIREFLGDAAGRWDLPPRWVVLAGDGSFDYRDVLGFGEALIPAPMAASDDGLFVSDNRLADFEGDDGVPDVSIGRLPVQTNAELEAYVDRLRAFESALETGAPWTFELAWVADDADEGGEFASDLEPMISETPPSMSEQRILVDEVGSVAARAELLATLQTGARLVTYLGHGGPDRLASEGLLVTGDVVGLTNGERLPVMTALTCSVGRFDLPGFTTLGESLVTHSGGGVAALWSPSSLTFNAESRELGELFLRALYGGYPRVGDAVRVALAEYVASGGGDPATPAFFVLLGDPAIDLGNP